MQKHNSIRIPVFRVGKGCIWNKPNQNLDELTRLWAGVLILLALWLIFDK